MITEELRKTKLVGRNCIAHHLQSYSSTPELRLDVENGTCLCAKHHDLFHKTYGYGGNTKAQFEEYKKEYVLPNFLS